MNKFPSITPYSFVANSPLKYVDKDGRDIYAIGTAEDVTKFTALLNKSTSLDVSLNPLTNQIIISGKPKSDADRMLLRASNSNTVNVNLYVTTATQFQSRTNQTPLLLGGAFEGSEIVGSKTNTFQWVNIEHFEMIENQGVGKGSKGVKHETLEAFIGAENSPGYVPIPRTSPNQPTAPEYNYAHGEANRLSNFPVEAEVDFYGNFNFVNLTNSARTSSFRKNGSVASTSGLENSASQSQNDARQIVNEFINVKPPTCETGCTLIEQ